MKANDYCLSLEQAKELQKLGIEFTEASMEFTHYDTDGADEWYLTMVDDYADSEFADIGHIETLTCTEMLGMLPKEIDGYQLKIVLFSDGYCVEYELYMKHIVYMVGNGVALDFCFSTLRDALFEMIKCLKKYKLM
jgi:hypothetical protein